MTPSLSALIPLATNHPARVESAAEALVVLGSEFPGLVVHLAARAVEGVTDKPTAAGDIARALACVSTDFLIFIEDDVQLGRGFADAVRASVARMAAESTLGVVSLFSRWREGQGFIEVPRGSFKQSQCVVIRSDAALAWLHEFAIPNPVLDWDIVLNRACMFAGLRIEQLLPSTAQHRGLPSVCGHICDAYTAPTFAG